jgi:aminoglycoside/choline kinase family phosphotransferase
LPELKAAAECASQRYATAFETLIALQCGVAAAALPAFDETALQAEMQLFTKWFCGELLGLTLSADETGLIERTQRQLASAALAQPQVAVHRDYHSRNLMLLDDESLGVIDFQDAVAGAYTYDLVSLLRDCYIEWPPAQVREWTQRFYERLVSNGLSAGRSETQFLVDFDLMGLQRHMKVLGIFARLHLRDQKSAYLADIPLVMRYFSSVAAQRPEFSEFAAWFASRVLPRAQAVLGELGVDCGGAAG